MMRASLSLGTTWLPTPMPVPRMTDFTRAASCIRLRGQRKKVLAREAVLAPAELASHLGAALLDHLLPLVFAEQRQRRERALAAALAGVAQRHVEARIDLLVVAALQHRGHHIFNGHLLHERAERRRVFDALLDARAGRLRGVREGLDDDAARGGDTFPAIQHAEENGGGDLLGDGQVARQLLRDATAGELEL